VHLLTAISSHGFGHAAQVAPVLNRLVELQPGLRLSVQSSLPERFLRERIRADFTLLPEAPDFGLLMHSALDIDLSASATAYAELHADWESRLTAAAQRLSALAPDLVLADIPYLTLAAAERAGIDAVALCSLNWADIYRHYFSDRPEAVSILAQMEAAYNSARRFLCPQPAMPMPFLANRQVINPLAAAGQRREAELRARLGIDAQQLLVLVTLGGVEARLAMEHWPAGQGIHWLVSPAWQVRHADVSSLQQTGFSFTDLVASCDAVLGKCGYGTVTECVVNATPLLYIPRPDWPEDRTLRDWLHAHDAGLAVPAERLASGRFADLGDQLRALSVRACVPNGAEQAARYLQSLLADSPARVAG
jgi:hypothetical protein